MSKHASVDDVMFIFSLFSASPFFFGADLNFKKFSSSLPYFCFIVCFVLVFLLLFFITLHLFFSSSSVFLLHTAYKGFP